MATYLFTWNPARWDWSYLQDSIAEVKKNGSCTERWGCVTTKKIKPGDRAFLMKLGEEPRGLIASGRVTSHAYYDLHWEATKKARGELAPYVDIEWDTILDPDIDVFPQAWLSSGKYPIMHWEPRASGVRIPDKVAEQLEEDWVRFLNQIKNHET